MSAQEVEFDGDVVTGDAATEMLLESRGIHFAYDAALPVEAIDQDASLTNQARDIPLVRDVVDRYAAALEVGDQFPAVLARRRGANGRLVLIGGNHRYAAHLAAGRTRIACYVLECDERTARRLAFEDNARHGLPPTDDERIAHATLLIDDGMTIAAAAALVGIGRGKLQIARDAARATTRAAKAKIVGFAQLSVSTRAHIGGVADSQVFVELARVATKGLLPAVEITKLVPHLNRVSVTEASKGITIAVDDERARRAEIEAGRKREGQGRRTQRLRLHTAASEILALLPADVTRGADAHELDDVADRCLEAARHLKRIHDHVKRAHR